MNAPTSTPESLPCPACRQVTYLPVDVAHILESGERHLRCPHCHQQFDLQQLLEQPKLCWEVVDDLPTDDSPVAVAEGTNASAAADTDGSSVSPGALTVDMPGHQTLVDDEWTYGLDQEHDHEVAADNHTDNYPDEVNDYSEELIAPTADSLSGDAELPLYPQPLLDAESASEKRHAAARDVLIDYAHTDEVDQPNTSKKPDWSNFQAKPRTRGGGKRSSSLWLVLQAALGGLAAIPISLLLMWHLLGTDIAGAAPWVAQYAPWIVPAKFHAYGSSNANSTTFSTPLAQPPMSPGASPQPPATAPAGQVTTDDLLEDSIPQPAASAFTTDAATYEQSNANENFSQSENRQSSLTVDPSRTGEAESPSETPTEQETSPAIDEPPELDAAAVENSFDLIRQTDLKLEEWSLAFQDKRPDLKSLALSTYEELSYLATALDQLPPRNAVLRTVRSQVRPIARRVQSQAEVQSLIEQGSLHWLRNRLTKATTAVPSPFPAATDEHSLPQSAAVGLAIIIDVERVETIDHQGETWTRLIVRSSPQSAGALLEIHVPPDAAVSLAEDQLQPGERLFLLGTVMPEKSPPAGETALDSAPSKKTFVANYLYPLLPK